MGEIPVGVGPWVSGDLGVARERESALTMELVLPVTYSSLLKAPPGQDKENAFLARPSSWQPTPAAWETGPGQGPGGSHLGTPLPSGRHPLGVGQVRLEGAFLVKRLHF